MLAVAGTLILAKMSSGENCSMFQMFERWSSHVIIERTIAGVFASNISRVKEDCLCSTSMGRIFLRMS